MLNHKPPIKRLKKKGWGEKIPIKKPPDSDVALFEKRVAMGLDSQFAG